MCSFQVSAESPLTQHWPPQNLKAQRDIDIHLIVPLTSNAALITPEHLSLKSLLHLSEFVLILYIQVSFFNLGLVLHINSDRRQPLETGKIDIIALLTALQVPADSHHVIPEHSCRENNLLMEDSLTPTHQ